MIGVELMWGVAWGAIGIVLGALIGIVDPPSLGIDDDPIVLGALIRLVGVMCAVAFTSIADIDEQRVVAHHGAAGRGICDRNCRDCSAGGAVLMRGEPNV